MSNTKKFQKYWRKNNFKISFLVKDYKRKHSHVFCPLGQARLKKEISKMINNNNRRRNFRPRPQKNNNFRRRNGTSNNGGGFSNNGNVNFSRNGSMTNPHNVEKTIQKFQQLAKDAQSSGDPVLVENYLQHADHYARRLAELNEREVK